MIETQAVLILTPTSNTAIFMLPVAHAFFFMLKKDKLSANTIGNNAYTYSDFAYLLLLQLLYQSPLGRNLLEAWGFPSVRNQHERRQWSQAERSKIYSALFCM